MTRAPEIGLGDYVRALHALRPTDAAECAAIAELLGISVLRAAAPRGESSTVRPPAARDEGPSPRVSSRRREEAPVPITRPTETLAPDAPHVRRVRAVSRGAPARLRSPRAAPLLADILKTHESSAGTLDDPTLFTSRWQRSIVSTALSTSTSGGGVDLRRTVEALAAGEPILELPQLSVATLRKGVQLLVDRSEGMRPFARDAAALAQFVPRVLGQVTQVLRFVGTPLRGAGTGALRTFVAYEPPRRGRPVLVLTDLGLGGAREAGERALPEEWLEFAELVRDAGCPCIAFVPLPSYRWPAALARSMHLVAWGRSTSAGTVRRSRPRGLPS